VKKADFDKNFGIEERGNVIDPQTECFVKMECASGISLTAILMLTILKFFVLSMMDHVEYHQYGAKQMHFNGSLQIPKIFRKVKLKQFLVQHIMDYSQELYNQDAVTII